MSTFSKAYHFPETNITISLKTCLGPLYCFSTSSTLQNIRRDSIHGVSEGSLTNVTLVTLGFIWNLLKRFYLSKMMKRLQGRGVKPDCYAALQGERVQKGDVKR